jgi:hypothetical protein
MDAWSSSYLSRSVRLILVGARLLQRAKVETDAMIAEREQAWDEGKEPKASARPIPSRRTNSKRTGSVECRMSCSETAGVRGTAVADETRQITYEGPAELAYLRDRLPRGSYPCRINR